MPNQARPWPIVTWSLVACFLIGLAYLLQSTQFSSMPLILIGKHQHLQKDQEIATRPRIELHPEDHVYRAPVTQYLDWHITVDHRRPDGVLKRVYLINDLFPGPTVEARSGDTLIITVENELLDESVTLHWHGLHVANSMDGAAGVSQCPISPGSRFVYNLTIPSDQSGTFWYHAHSGVSRADGIYGGLIVHAPASKSTVRGLMAQKEYNDQPYTYEKELLLLIGDWYHRPASDVLEWYMDPGNFGNEPIPDSLLINGVGRFDCSMAVPALPLDCTKGMNWSIMDLVPDMTYRIRVVNTGALAGFTLSFSHHVLDLMQVDSIDVQRLRQRNANSVGILYPGQRMDFILPPSSQSTNKQSYMTVQLDQDCFKYTSPALTPDQTFPINHHPTSTFNTSSQPPVVINHVNIQEVPSAPSILNSLPPTAEQTHVIYTKIQKMARYSNKPFGYINQTTWKPQQHPPAPLTTLPRTKWDKNQLTITTGPDSVWIDLVINNLDEGSHPFHLHGHHFYILATYQASSGWGSYNPFTDKSPPHAGSDLERDSPSSASLSRGHPDQATEDENNTGSTPNISSPYVLSRAALRDTVNIPSRGYAVLRFRAENVGVWLLHCHVLWHSVTGMAMLIDVGNGRELGAGGGDGDGVVCSDSPVLG
ncbi:uncharacterized protein N7446_001512 [Penicillium canescens]|uniref:Uncharacterized protein n=1 Tax=Penicillium canescens TaxID=5083 RepID=A0AAD6N8X5_PENCN|nr:uncharacterized protein N7446_001512 [Penicillium canescens]KAJ6043317.1 hypothetical protein N7460_004672 [Penicillium canescens]KAJ6054791.1 hypothetical protein N7444_003889 [Penicillium canescens]KAJ6073735.1 hypothetical protein N7446_001512 [Penicillium canescens]